jgi:hypothetical protein
MARTTAETARILSQLFDHNFGQDFSETYRISWPQLRSLAAVPRLNEYFLKAVNVALSDFGQTLIPLSNSLLIARETGLDDYRSVPDRLLEEYLPDGCESTSDDDQELGDDDED